MQCCLNVAALPDGFDDRGELRFVNGPPMVTPLPEEVWINGPPAEEKNEAIRH